MKTWPSVHGRSWRTLDYMFYFPSCKPLAASSVKLTLLIKPYRLWVQPRLPVCGVWGAELRFSERFSRLNCFMLFLTINFCCFVVRKQVGLKLPAAASKQAYASRIHFDYGWKNKLSFLFLIRTRMLILIHTDFHCVVGGWTHWAWPWSTSTVGVCAY